MRSCRTCTLSLFPPNFALSIHLAFDAQVLKGERCLGSFTGHTSQELFRSFLHIIRHYILMVSLSNATGFKSVGLFADSCICFLGDRQGKEAGGKLTRILPPTPFLLWKSSSCKERQAVDWKGFFFPKWLCFMHGWGWWDFRSFRTTSSPLRQLLLFWPWCLSVSLL